MSDIIFDNVTFGYDDKNIFDGFSAQFEDGKINVILGGSGVGKTTLLALVAGSLKPTFGTVNGAEGGVAYIFQKDRLIPSISVYKNLDLVLKRTITDKKQRAETIGDMLDKLEIGELAQRYPKQLSGGQAQRVAMARAFLYPANVLLLDEPFKGLDTALKARLISLLADLCKSSPRAVIFVTHAIDECLLAADNYYVLDRQPAQISLKGDITLPKEGRNLTDDALSSVRSELLSALCGE